MKVSVIIPAYNAERSLTRALESVVNQKVKPFEIIIVNDGSKDNTEAVANEFIEKNKSFNIKLISKKNGGVSSARNAGLKVAQGDFIALLDSDDEWFLDKLEKQLDLFKKNSEISFIGGLIFEPKSGTKGELIRIDLSKLIFKNYFQPSTVIFKREIVDTVGLFDESQNYAEEGNYFMRIASKYNCALMNEQVVLYDQGKKGFGQSGLSANLKEMEKGELKNLKFAYSQGYIGFFRYGFAVGFSIAKYFRRILIVKLKK